MMDQSDVFVLFSGEVCLDLLTPGNKKWTAATSLTTVIEEVTKLIDEPAVDLVQHTGQND
jgi:ubiquitin-protein ligase